MYHLRAGCGKGHFVHFFYSTGHGKLLLKGNSELKINLRMFSNAGRSREVLAVRLRFRKTWKPSFFTSYKSTAFIRVVHISANASGWCHLKGFGKRKMWKKKGRCERKKEVKGKDNRKIKITSKIYCKRMEIIAKRFVSRLLYYRYLYGLWSCADLNIPEPHSDCIKRWKGGRRLQKYQSIDIYWLWGWATEGGLFKAHRAKISWVLTYPFSDVG
jgi:hypothetical protein